MTIDVGSRYQVLEKLGEGGMGAVYLVQDASGKQVALKALTAAAGMDEAAFLGFKQEFRTMAKLRHPNTCEVYDYGRLPDGTPFFTMEVVPGIGLDESIPLPPNALGSILQQLASALGYIHQQGFVHCDLKPENVRLRPDGTLKLMDFGLMEVSGRTLDAIKGTLAYLAPEVARQGRIDARTDLYGLGAVAYHLLTGEPPFKAAEAEGAVAILRAHLEQPPRPPRELRPEIPPLVERVLLKLLAKEPAARYASVADMLTDLGLEAGEGAEANLLASAFVGRADELVLLQGGLDLARRNGTQVVWLTGPAGSGKSRLLSELRFAVQLEDTPFASGTCSDVPYGPFVEALRALLPAAGTACPAELHDLAPLLSKLLPELADGRPAPALEPQEEKVQLQGAIATLIVKALSPAGVLALEGWQQADALSVETLQHLLRNAGSAHLLVAIATQAEPGEGAVLPLPPLGHAASAELLASMLGCETLPAGFADRLHELSAGNPRALTHMLEHLHRHGHLKRARGRWVLPEAIAPEDLPRDQLALLLDRLASLSPAAMRVAELAAVVAQPIDVALAAALSGLEDDALFDALDEAVRAKVLLPLEQHQYAFADADVRQALYDRLEASERLRLHTAIAGYLDARSGEAPAYTELVALARHFLAAAPEGRTKAIRYALAAGQRGLEIFALDTARQVLEAGYALLDQQGKPRELYETYCDYLNALATLYHWTFEIDLAHERIAEGVRLAEKLGDKPRLLEALVTLAKNGTLAGTNARVAESVTLLERAAALADELGNVRVGVRARVNAGRALFFAGQNARARTFFEAAVALSRSAGLESWYAASLCFLGYLEFSAGSATREQGVAHLQEAITLQERQGDKGGMEYSYNLLFETQLQVGRYREAEVSAQRNTALAKELGIQDDYVIGLLNQCILAVEMGRFERALDVGGACEHRAREMAHRVALPLSQTAMAVATLQRGRFARGVELLRAAEGLARETSNYVYSIAVPFVVEGWMLVGNLQQAFDTAQESLFMLRSMDDLPGQTRMWSNLAEIQERQGQLASAREFADRAVAAATEAEAAGALARALLAKAGVERKDHPEEARQLAERALALAAAAGADLLQARASQLLGELALDAGRPDALPHFQAAQALADQMDAPLARAFALFGQSQAGGSGLVEAQQALRGLGQELEEGLRKTFLAQPDVARVLDKIPGLVDEPMSSPEASLETLERLQRVSQDLQVAAGRYGALFREWTGKSAQLEMLNDLARQVNETLHLEHLLVKVVHLTLQITKAERGFLLLRDPEQPDGLLCEAAFNQFGRPIDQERPSSSVCQKVLTSGQPLAVMDVTEDAELNAAQSIAALNLRTLMCVPLRANGQVLGVLYVDSQAVVTTFTAGDLGLLRAIASHASVAIENATLYSALNRRAAELERAIEQFRKADYEASTDMLSGLRNRRYFTEQATRELDISRRYQRSLSVIMLDVDHFKRFNDSQGHAMGDQVLKAFGLVLTKAVRSCDLAARLGGEEFVVLCPDTGAEGARVVAERVRDALSRSSLQGLTEGIRLTASFGIAGIQPGDTELNALLGRAEAALHAAKEAGRDRVTLWHDALAPARA